VTLFGKIFNRKEVMVGIGRKNVGMWSQDIPTWIEVDWIETRNRKNIYGMKAPWVESLTLGEQVGVKPCLWTYSVHVMIEMEYFHPLLPNLEVYYLIYWLKVCFEVDVVHWWFLAH
jgi:hypothetical protein